MDYNRTIANKLKIYMFCIGISILIVVKNIIWQGMSEYMFTLALALCIFGSTPNERFLLLAFTIPLSPGLPMTEIIVMYVLAELLISRKQRLDSRLFVSVVILSILLVTGDFLYSSQVGSIYSILYSSLTLCAYILLSVFFVDNEYSDDELLTAALLFVISTIFAFSVVSVVSIRASSLSTFLSGSIRFGKTVKYIGYEYKNKMILSYNTNQAGQFCAIAIAMCLSVLKGRKTSPFISYLMIGILFFFGFMTLSKSFLVSLGLIIVSVLLLPNETKTISIGKKLLTRVAFILVIAVVMRIMPDAMKLALNNRLDVEDISNGRTQILTDEILYLGSHLNVMLFGAGAYGYQNLMNNVVAHNMIAEMIMSWGVIGVVEYMLYIFRIYCKQLKTRFSKYTALPMMICVVAAQFGQFVSTKTLLLLLPFCLLLARNYIGDENAYRQDWIDINRI